jgi:flagellum-specific peptidoglycan hydrolase FlgJ
MQLTAARKQKLLSIVPMAVRAERRFGFDPALRIADLLVAQYGIESMCGDAVFGNNCFGIKANSRVKERQLLRTREYFTDSEASAFLASNDGRTCELAQLSEQPSQPRKDGRRLYQVRDWFAKYPSIGDCFNDRLELSGKGKYLLMLSSYREHRDFARFAREMARIYSTSKPEEYANLVIGYATIPEVVAALAAARDQQNTPPSPQ